MTGRSWTGESLTGRCELILQGLIVGYDYVNIMCHGDVIKVKFCLHQLLDFESYC